MKTPGYIVSLDAEKAFDRVWRDGLFFKLKDRMCETLWYLVFKYYKLSSGYLKFNGLIYTNFVIKIDTGVKQGGVLSPYFFNVYIDDLLKQIYEINNGLKIANYIISALAYCDDILIICKSLNLIRKIVGICETYSMNWLLKFNENKSVVIHCGNKIYDDEQLNINLNRLD